MVTESPYSSYFCFFFGSLIRTEVDDDEPKFRIHLRSTNSRGGLQWHSPSFREEADVLAVRTL